jgi:hypothetical protein
MEQDDIQSWRAGSPPTTTDSIEESATFPARPPTYPLGKRVGLLLEEASGEIPEQPGLVARLGNMILELYQRTPCDCIKVAGQVEDGRSR